MIYYSPGVDYLCPKCNSNLVCFFFDAKCKGWFEAMKWIRGKKIILSDSLEDYVATTISAKWICKRCFNGGTIQKIL
jgi:hypothetical protein